MGDVVERDQLTGEWNAVFVDGNWRFVHVRWGTVALVGHSSGQWTLVEENGEMVTKQLQKSAGRLVFSLNEYWFFTGKVLFYIKFDHPPSVVKCVPKNEISKYPCSSKILCIVFYSTIDGGENFVRCDV